MDLGYERMSRMTIPLYGFPRILVLEVGNSLNVLGSSGALTAKVKQF
jgi:hypothetical protein